MNHFEINKEAWNKRTDIHIDSDFYDNKNFIKGNTSLNKIELDLLGDIKGKSILHLQCHFGQDTISLERMGATVTGVDISDNAINKATVLSQTTNSKATFICCNIYDLKKHLNKKFDIVFTSYGTITWLPDLNKWANIISHFLKAKGQLIFAEFHPFVWMYDDDFKKIKYNYFNRGEIIEDEESTYAEKHTGLSFKSVTWNHSISEVINSLLQNNLEIKAFNEYNYSPYNCFNNTKKINEKEFIIQPFENKVPLVYSILALKKI